MWFTQFNPWAAAVGNCCGSSWPLDMSPVVAMNIVCRMCAAVRLCCYLQSFTILNVTKLSIEGTASKPTAITVHSKLVSMGG